MGVHKHYKGVALLQWLYAVDFYGSNRDPYASTAWEPVWKNRVHWRGTPILTAWKCIYENVIIISHGSLESSNKESSIIIIISKMLAIFFRPQHATCWSLPQCQTNGMSSIRVFLSCLALDKPSGNLHRQKACRNVLSRDLTHWGRDKMDGISQTTFSSAFSWMKMFEFQLKFQWHLFLRVQSIIFQHWFI